MNKIDDLIRRYNDWSTGDDEADIFIKVKLRMIRSLFDEIKDSEERIYMEEIISKFAEIMDCQHEVIGGLMTEIMADAGYGPMKRNWISASGERSPRTTQPILTADDIPWDPEEVARANDIPSYLPPEGGFQTDEQAKKAFTNYLTYHVVRKTRAGKVKPFSVHTIYDYSSRIKVLWEIVYGEWKASDRNGQIQLDAQSVVPGCAFLNAYHNLCVLQKYVEMKEVELREISTGLREPLSAEDIKRNPLNNVRNLNNTMAALAKLEEFKQSITAVGSIY